MSTTSTLLIGQPVRYKGTDAVFGHVWQEPDANGVVHIINVHGATYAIEADVIEAVPVAIEAEDADTATVQVINPDFQAESVGGYLKFHAIPNSPRLSDEVIANSGLCTAGQLDRLMQLISLTSDERAFVRSALSAERDAAFWGGAGGLPAGARGRRGQCKGPRRPAHPAGERRHRRPVSRGSPEAGH